MITRITGNLETIEDGIAQVDPGQGLVYAVHVPGFVAARMGGLLGQSVTLHTIHFLEAQSQGNTMLPRLAGFLTKQDRAFFELFTTCKGLGPRRALRALSLPTHQIAMAVEDRDTALLQSMPEIGKRLAETIVVTLKGKVDPYLEPASAAKRAAASGSTSGGGGASGGGDDTIEAELDAPERGGQPIVREALGVLVQLGENRQQAVQWIDRIMAGDDPPTSASQLVTEVYQLKAGG